MSAKGGIYYSDFHVDPLIMEVCKKQIEKVFDGDIVSVSLRKPMDLGRNIVLDLERGYITYVRQIITALENSISDYVFFLEHDVLYSQSHFDFIPPRDDIFYYNENVLRWYFGSDKAITHDRMLPLSCLCTNKKLALMHYNLRLEKIMEHIEEFSSHEPRLARKWGYEPGTKKRKRGGLTDDDFETWHSEIPVIDIRHKEAFSPPKCKIDDFKHPPLNWREVSVDEIAGWNLKGMFNGTQCANSCEK